MPQDSHRLAHWLLKNVNRAIYEFSMIEDGDRVAVALSGGKDSLTLLRLLDWRRAHAPERYELFAVYVPGDANGPQAVAHPPLVDWLIANDYAYTVEPLQIPESEPLPLGCRRCTWNRRRALFAAARRLDCNVVAFGHHADDLAQTTLLNLLFHGQVETMTPRGEYFGGTFRLVRPLCYLEEGEIRRFARSAGFPDPPPECPQSEHSRRRFVADLIRRAEREGVRTARANLLRAGLKGIGMRD